MSKRVVVGLSGGVDSSVAAYVLQQEGYEVVGLFMRNWHDTTGTLQGECTWEDDRTFAELVAEKLDIEFHFVDLSNEYRKRVVDYMFDEYGKGRTPNPDVLCNREIKFDAFAKEAFKLGADYLATGHYCRKMFDEATGEYHLLAGLDGNKDQSYFLCQLSQEQLKTALFPIGEMTKPEVRRIAEELHLATAKRKDSQGICFVGKVDLPVFLQQKLTAKKGNVILISNDWEGYSREHNMYEPYIYNESDGRIVGEHCGAQFYTIGQRKGLKIGGFAEPLFIIGTDTEKNIIYVGMGENHRGLMRSGLFSLKEDIHWIVPSRCLQIGESREYSIRIRYRQPLQKGWARMEENGLYVTFDQPQRAATPGQFISLYEGDDLVGSSVIAR